MASKATVVKCKYDDDEDQILKEMKKRLAEVTHNYEILLAEWKKLQNVLKTDNVQIPDNFVLVHKEDLSQLATETSQLRLTLPRVINKQLVTAASRADSLEEELEKLRVGGTEAETARDEWRTRCEASVAECQKEREENLRLRCELQEMSDQLSQQSEFCSSLGASSCSLLWRISRSEESVQSLLSGKKIEDFLALVTSTVGSYVSAYKDDWPEQQTDETNFILALVGIITNLAASAYGRDFLISRDSGRHLVDSFINFVAEAPLKKSTRLKNLVLMSLYNLSINQKGLKYISCRQGIMSLLAWHLQEETDRENRLNTLRLIQSLISDDKTPAVMHELAEAMPESLLQELTTDKNKETQDLALELIMELRHVNSEQ